MKYTALGFGAVVLLGHENYYPRFGYGLAEKFGVKLPFDVPAENCMAIELVEGALRNVSGVVEYPREFHPVVWMVDDNFEKIGYCYFNSGAIIESESGIYADKTADISCWKM